MKNYSIFIGSFMLLFAFALPLYAQDSRKISLTNGKIEPYRMEITYDKTSHLIFPSSIRYVDLGSDYIIAGKAEDAENVLRVKAALKDFDTETNFSVITNDGHFYSFNVLYHPEPDVLNYDLQTLQNEEAKKKNNDVLFEELGDTNPSLADLLLETIYHKNKRYIKHIGSRNYGILFLLKGIYIHNGKYYFHTELRNHNNVPFQVDFVHLKVVDKKIAKRTVIQEHTIVPLRNYKSMEIIEGKTTAQNVMLLDQFTIDDNKVLLIEIFEKNGSRHQILQVENSDLIKARLISDMHIKF